MYEARRRSPGARLAPTSLLTALVALAQLGCASGMFRQWDEQLKQMMQRPTRLADVSLLLGSPPERCESVDATQPRIGVLWDDALVIRTVAPESPAQRAGLRPGMRLLSIAGVRPRSPQEAAIIANREFRYGVPVPIETDQGSFSPVPTISESEQCYWNISAGQVARAGSGASWGRFGGGAWGGGEAYHRYYRASCRFQGGWLVACTSQWQM